MTNKPKLSVERELLESFAAYVADSPNAVMRARATKLRAILDKPCDYCSFCQGRGAVSADHMNMRTCPKCKAAAQHQGEPVAWQRTSAMQGGKWFDLPAADVEAAKSAGYAVRPLFVEQPAPVAVVPEGYCIMPRRLTAENGAKALLLGEFKLRVTKECSECCELEEPTEGCSMCDGEGEYEQRHTIPWDQIKFIYSQAVAGLARISKPL